MEVVREEEEPTIETKEGLTSYIEKDSCEWLRVKRVGASMREAEMVSPVFGLIVNEEGED